mgnify:CR=1 FL=1
MTIMGYQWEDIQRAQQGGRLGCAVPHEVSLPKATAADMDLLKEHGEAGLQRLGYCGTLDRLANAGLLKGAQR